MDSEIGKEAVRDSKSTFRITLSALEIFSHSAGRALCGGQKEKGSHEAPSRLPWTVNNANLDKQAVRTEREVLLFIEMTSVYKYSKRTPLTIGTIKVFICIKQL